MKICGITAEYNPFHNGHAYQIQKAREESGCDLVLSVMSGNFVQRGEPAVLNKYRRAEAAVSNGVDVVIELPFLYSIQAASGFAHGSISLMKLAGVDSVCFGSECGNLENLLEIADTPVNPDHLHVSLDCGMSFPRAYSLLASSMEPNDILAVSYLKELKGSGIRPIAVQRTSAYLDEELHETSSALAIRTALKNKEDLRDTTPMKEVLQDSFLPWPELYWPYLRTFLLTTSSERLSGMFLFSEGIENHLKKCAEAQPTWEGFLNAAVNYRYTRSRIRRTCLCAMMQLSKQEVNKLPPLDTLHVLAFNDNGKKWLHAMRKSDIRIASRFADIPYPWRAMEYRASLLYTSVFPEEIRKQILQEEISGAHYVKNSEAD